MNLGTMALEYGERVDFERLRRERRQRCLSEMARDGIDALLLGREANARYVSGARRLWTVGMRPFGPGCVLLASGDVHLLTTWDDGIPDEIPPTHLFQTTWNPSNLIAHLQSIEGLARARRVGVDGMTPMFERLLGAAFPEAEWVDATAALGRARARKTPDEIDCIRTANAIAEGALAAVLGEIAPGRSERELMGRYQAELARLGVTIPGREASFCATPRRANGAPPLRQLSAQRPLAGGDLVAIQAGGMYAGYEGAVGRSAVCGAPSGDVGSLARRLDAVRQALVAGCRAGASVTSVCRAYERCGERPPQMAIVHGTGLGVEPPVAGPTGDPADAVLEADMVVALHAYVWQEGVGGLLARDTVRVTDNGAEHLGASPTPIF